MKSKNRTPNVNKLLFAGVDTSFKEKLNELRKIQMEERKQFRESQKVAIVELKKQKIEKIQEMVDQIT